MPDCISKCGSAGAL